MLGICAVFNKKVGHKHTLFFGDSMKCKTPMADVAN